MEGLQVLKEYSNTPLSVCVRTRSFFLFSEGMKELQEAAPRGHYIRKVLHVTRRINSRTRNVSERNRLDGILKIAELRNGLRMDEDLAVTTTNTEFLRDSTVGRLFTPRSKFKAGDAMSTAIPPPAQLYT
jgi:hypothetical protein